MNPFKSFRSPRVLLFIVVALLMTGCSDGPPSLPQRPDLSDLPAVPDLSQLPDLSDLPQLPGIPTDLGQIPELLNELQLPDLSGIAGLPQLEDLPLRSAPPGGIVFTGPTERSLQPGDRIPGTDIELVSVTEDSAEFLIDGMRSPRIVGDSLDYDGAWRGADGMEYNLRMRIYRVGANSIRGAGVHQLTVENIDPTRTGQPVTDQTVRLPFTAGADAGETFPGLTYGYGGSDERGAQITGLPEGEYPYRKAGDSISWRGTLRSDIPAEYSLRMLPYTETRGQVGGTVKLALPQ